jgi:type 1 glutamine amidotransferase/HEAT repeat protein
MTKSNDLEVRISAYDVVGVIGRPSDVSMLAQKASETESAEKQAVQRALVRLPGDDVESEMIRILKSAEPAVKVQILKCLMLRKARAACEDVMDLVESEDSDVRKSAYALIAELGTPDHLPRLLTILIETKNVRTLQNTEKTAAKICLRYPEQSLPLLLKQVNVTEAKAYYALLRLLSATKQPQALKVIRAALKDESKDTRIVAIKILSSWPNEQVIADLLDVATNDLQASCRILAFRGYLRLLKQSSLPPEILYEKFSQALAIAERDQEKVQALTALSTVGTIDSLELIEPYLEEETMRTESALAIYNVCQLLQNEDPGRCKESLGKALDALDGDDPVVDKIKGLLNRIEMYQGRLLTEWDFQNDTEQWIPENDIDMAWQEGTLKLVPTGGDPYLSIPLNIRGGDLEIHLKVKAKKTTTWQIFWGSNTKPLAQLPIWLTNFEVPPSEDQWQNVTVPIFVEDNLATLRIDPGAGSDVIFIDSIQILLSEKAATLKGPMFNPEAKTRILLIGTPLDHPFGSHMYMHDCGVLAKCLKQVEGVDDVVSMGWPEDEALLEDIDAIVLYSSPGAEILLTGNHTETFKKLMAEGAGLTCLHWSTGIGDANNKQLETEYLSYLGGIFSFAFSGLDVVQTKVRQHQSEHAICSGWLDYDQYDEIYLRTKILEASVPQVSVDVKGTEEVVAWTYERPDSNGGRSYGNTLGHFHDNFWIPSFRRNVVNGILWTAHHEVPEGGAVCLITPEDMLLDQI